MATASTTLTGILTDTATGIQYNVMTTTTPIVVVAPPPPPVVVVPPPPPPVVVVPPPPPPPAIVKSPDNTAVTNTTSSLIDASLVKWSITAGGKCLVGTLLDATTANVVGILLHAHKVYHWNAAGNWYLRAVGNNPPWTFQAGGDPRIVVVAATPGSNFTVTAAGGFKTPTGVAWNMRGMNGGVNDCMQMRGNILTQFPKMTCVRLNTGGNDSDTAIDQVVKLYTGQGIVVEVEDHSGNPNDVAWYTRMATAYKNNPLVFLEMPNEPNGSNLAAIQTGLVKAIRAAGFNNPIALQPMGGYDFSHIPNVAIDKTNVFITPHIYYSGSDPNGAQQYLDNDIGQSLNLGYFPSIDEFGEAMDGWNWNQFGASVVTSVVAANKAGKCGAVYWAMNNGLHSNGADSAFTAQDGSQLSPTGLQLKANWLG